MSTFSLEELEKIKILLCSPEPTNWEIASQILLGCPSKHSLNEDFLSFLWGVIIFKTNRQQQLLLLSTKVHLLSIIKISAPNFYKQTKHLTNDFKTFKRKFRSQQEQLYKKLSSLVDRSPLVQNSFFALALEQPEPNFLYSWQCRFLVERGLLTIEEFHKLFIRKSYPSLLNTFSCSRIPIKNIPTKYLDSLDTANLGQVSLSCNQLKELPTLFYQLTKLNYLAINQNPIQYIRPNLNNWKNLKTLILYKCKQLQELPESLILSTKLHRLELTSCKLYHFPKAILEASTLELLSLRGNKFRSIFDNLGQLQKLKTLNLGSNINLTQLPDSIGQLQELQELQLSNCALTSLPSSIGNLKKLHNLRLGSNQLQELPDSFFELENLEELSLSNNLIPLSKSFLDRLLQLPKLRYLLLSNMPITTKVYQEYYLPILKPRFPGLYIQDPAT